MPTHAPGENAKHFVALRGSGDSCGVCGCATSAHRARGGARCAARSCARATFKFAIQDRSRDRPETGKAQTPGVEARDRVDAHAEEAVRALLVVGEHSRVELEDIRQELGVGHAQEAGLLLARGRARPGVDQLGFEAEDVAPYRVAEGRLRQGCGVGALLAVGRPEVSPETLHQLVLAEGLLVA